jgi:diguanylate cyclase (GGDEF)-like protein
VFLGLALILASVTVLPGAPDGPLPPRHATVYAVFSLSSVACVLVGSMHKMAYFEALSSVRSTLEAVLIAVAIAAAGWQLVFYDIVGTQGQGLQTVLLLLADGFIYGVALLAATRGRDFGFTVAAFAAGGLVLEGLISQHAQLTTGNPGWAGVVASCLCWPLVVIGLYRADASARVLSVTAQARVEWRSLTVVATVMVVGAWQALHAARESADSADVTWGLIGAFFIALWLRELIRAWQSSHLITLLGRDALRDPLTGLANLRSLDDHFDDMLRRSGPVSVITVDLDRFKDVNDLLGHPIGDQLLTSVAKRLRDLAVTQRAKVFRMGGDEYVIIGGSGHAEAERMADDVAGVVASCVDAIPSLRRVPVTASVGVCHLRVDGSSTHADLHLALAHSGHAMRKAKISGNDVAVFDEPLADSYRRRRTVEALLRERIATGVGVDVKFQPILSLTSHQVEGAEALARWTDDWLGPISPAEFIEVAEDCGLIEALGEHILRRALTGAIESGLVGHGRWVAVNVSALQLRVPGFAGTVSRALGQAGVSARHLVIEVTESVFVRPDDPAVETLSELAGLGVRISLDDFGTGYSSLGYLARLPVHELKIDRSITAKLDDPKTIAVAGSIVDMAHRLDLDVVVEGVETAEQERRAIALDLDRVQGWLYSPAVGVVELRQLISDPSRCRP